MRLLWADASQQNIGRSATGSTGPVWPYRSRLMRLKPGSYLILGMLDTGVSTGYAIKRAVDRSTRFFWAASLAQVYPELAALESGGYIVGSDEPHGDRPRKTYRLTDTGHAALQEWLRSERVPDFEQRDEGLLRLFFADALPAATPSSSSGASASARRRSTAIFRPRSCRWQAGCPVVFDSSQRAKAPTTSRGALRGFGTWRPSSPPISTLKGGAARYPLRVSRSVHVDPLGRPGCASAGALIRCIDAEHFEIKESHMTQYFLTLPHDSAEEPTMESMDPAALQEVFAAVEGFDTRLKDDGAWVFAGGLHPPSAATTVDATGDTPILTDGPYVEAKEYLGGFWIIEAPDLDAAIEYAKLGSKALQGRIEVRPFQEPPQDES